MSEQAKYRAAADRLVNYLASDLAPDGSSQAAPDDIQFYYKLPAVLTMAGRRGAAARALNQFASRFVEPGAIRTDAASASWEAYLAGWAAWGAGLLGRFDLARTIMSAVAHLQDAGGGFTHRAGNRPLVDVERTSGAA